MKSKGLAFLLLVSIVLFGACSTKSKEEPKKQEKKLSVITTFYPMYEFTKNIVGDTGEVSLLIPSGTEPHDFEPSAKDIAKIQEADVFIYNDKNMETWAPQIINSVDNKNLKVIHAAEDILLLPGTDHDHDHEGEEEGHTHELDPHVWLAPSLAIKEVETIRDQLITTYPEYKNKFQKNADSYLEKLKKLDQKYQASLKNAEQKNFVTQHAAFGYLALEYGLNQVPISGLSPDQEPTAKRLAELKKYVSENGIKYIYFEENASDKIARTLADEADVKLAVLNPLESVTEKDQKAGKNYISIMEDNLKSLEKTTQGKSSKEVILPEDEHSEKTVYQGYFEDQEVADRPLSDWSGDWQSVYPLLEEGTLDQVFDYKAKLKKNKTAAEYKEYYTSGYQTNVDKIIIDKNTINFVYDGKDHKTTYRYAGKEILNYEAGNRGVRFLFEAITEVPGAFRYVQFSDHSIAPTKAEHFHIYFGDESQDALLKQMDNWPTYYPSNLSGQEIAQEMMAH